MSSQCPWCEALLDRRLVNGLTSVGEPCPACGKPIRQSPGQVLAIVLMLLPLVAGTLYLSKVLYDAGTQSGAIFVIFAGLVVGASVQRFLPVVSGPARGFPVRK